MHHPLPARRPAGHLLSASQMRHRYPFFPSPVDLGVAKGAAG
jgi:hypothetical protein